MKSKILPRFKIFSPTSGLMVISRNFAFHLQIKNISGRPSVQVKRHLYRYVTGFMLYILYIRRLCINRSFIAEQNAKVSWTLTVELLIAC
jgi:hypothetical protein